MRFITIVFLSYVIIIAHQTICWQGKYRYNLPSEYDFERFTAAIRTDILNNIGDIFVNKQLCTFFTFRAYCCNFDDHSDIVFRCCFQCCFHHAVLSSLLLNFDVYHAVIRPHGTFVLYCQETAVSVSVLLAVSSDTTVDANNTSSSSGRRATMVS